MTPNALVGNAGTLFIKASQQWLDQFEDVKFQSLRGASARKTLLVVGIMTAHALGEGSGVGVSFCGRRGWSQVRCTMSCCFADGASLPCSPSGLQHWCAGGACRGCW